MNKLCIYLSRILTLSVSVGISKNTNTFQFEHIGYTIIVDELETWNIV